MSLIEHYRAMARNNAYSNPRLLAACCRLEDEAFRRERVSFFPSLVATLNHVFIVDRFYIAGLRGETPDYSFFVDEVPYAEAGALRDAQALSDRELIRLCDGLGEANLGRNVLLDRGPQGVHRESVGSVLPHLFVHQIHHRGQAHAMLSGTPVPPPQLDEFFLVSDRSLRADDERAFGRGRISSDRNPV